MLKFLRKYNILILAVGGSLLMVAFLLPQAIGQIGQSLGDPTVYVVDGKKIKQTQHNEAINELRAADTVLSAGLPISYVRGVIGVDGPEHWYLYARAAEDAGLVGRAGDGASFVQERIDAVIDSISIDPAFRGTPEGQAAIDTYRAAVENAYIEAGRDRGMTREEIDLAVAKARGMMRLRDTYADILSRPSAPRALIQAKRDFDQAIFNFVFIAASRLLSETAEPTEEQLQAHLDRFANDQAIDNEFRIGYLLPNRVKVEWLRIDRQSLAEGVSVDLIEVSREYQERFEGDPDAPPIQQVRVAIENELRDAQIDEIMRTIDTVVRAEFARALRGVPTRGAYRELPDNWNDIRPNISDIASTVVDTMLQQYGTQINRPGVFVREDKYYTEAELERVDGIGAAFVQRSGRPVGFPEMAVDVFELVGANDFNLQVGVPGPTLRGIDGDAYYFVVTDSRAESPLDSVATRRDDLERTTRVLMALEQMTADADMYKQRAITEGFPSLLDIGEDTWEGQDAPRVASGNDRIATEQVVYPRIVTPDRPDRLLNQAPIREAILAEARKIDPALVGDEIPDDLRYAAIPVTQLRGLLVVEFMGFVPATTQEYQSNQQQLAASFLAEGLDVALEALGEDDRFELVPVDTRFNLNGPFTLANLRARFNVTDRDGSPRVDEDEEGE